MPHLHRFHHAPLTPETDFIFLDGPEAHHALHTARLRKGDAIEVFDGVGNAAKADILEADRKTLRLALSGMRHTPRPEHTLTVAVGWPNKEKTIEDLVHRGSELGVSAFWFFRAERSERTPSLSPKWGRIAIECCKQTGRDWLPEFHIHPNLAVALEPPADVRLIGALDCEPIPICTALTARPRTTVLYIGPEGDFTSAEIAQAISKGAAPINLGPHILRTEAAANLGAALVLYELGELGPVL